MFTRHTSNRGYSLGIAAGLIVSLLIAIASLAHAVAGLQVVA